MAEVVRHVFPLLAMKNQYRVDYTIPFRCMQCDTMEYSDQLSELRSKNIAKIKRGLQQLLENNPEYQRMDIDTLEVVSVLLKAPKIWENRMKYLEMSEKKEEYNMCQALRDWIEEERENGVAVGKVAAAHAMTIAEFEKEISG